MSIRNYQHFIPKLGKRVFVDPSAIIIGKVEIGDDCSIWPLVAIRADMNHIQIGQCTSIQDGSILHITHAGPFTTEKGFPLTIGDSVTVGHGAILHGCTICNYVLIGMGSTVLDGAIIEDHVILGAGSLVPPGKTLKSGYLYVGSPAKPARKLTEKELKLLMYSADNYVRLKDTYLE
ncbi:UNVERIFIED_CONTAM: hypothetical protein GTU68_008231 [Idotea baltica]|nr:hypothetical protein [Idotea baltica]